MDKYLFTDGISGVREVHSREELFSLIQSATITEKARVWLFNSNEWIPAAFFLAKNPIPSHKAGNPAGHSLPPVSRSRARRFRTPLLMLFIVTGTLLIFTFSSAGWENNGLTQFKAAWPANVPVLDQDSLVAQIEFSRGKTLDKSTRHNLRLRNTWPGQILLQIRSEKETRGSTSRFLQPEIVIDNASGAMIDQAIVALETWGKGRRIAADTLQFSNIRYDRELHRKLPMTFRSDSLSVSFISIRAKSFNFCYDIKNNSGNPNDRWFCPGGKSTD